jgi:hypothetical protein
LRWGCLIADLRRISARDVRTDGNDFARLAAEPDDWFEAKLVSALSIEQP